MIFFFLMGKKQVDLCGGSINSEKTKKIDSKIKSNLVLKAETENEAQIALNILNFLKITPDILYLVRNKEYQTLKQYTQNLAGKNFRIVNQIISFLDQIREEDNEPLYEFSSQHSSKTILHETIKNLTPLYHSILRQLNLSEPKESLEHIHAFFEMLINIVDNVIQGIDFLIEYHDRISPISEDDFNGIKESVCAQTFSYTKKPHVNLEVNLTEDLSPIFTKIKFYEYSEY